MEEATPSFMAGGKKWMRAGKLVAIMCAKKLAADIVSTNPSPSQNAGSLTGELHR